MNELPQWIRRFEFELPAILDVARLGDNRAKGGGDRLRYTWNVISYFVWCVSNDRTPIDRRVLAFVADFLRDTHPNQLAREARDAAIFQGVSKALREGYQINPAAEKSAAVQVAERFFCSPENVVSVYYRVKREGVGPLHAFCRDVAARETYPRIAKVLADQGNALLSPNDAGERLRATLQLAGYAWWRRRHARHAAVAQEVAHEAKVSGSKKGACRTVAARHGVPVATVEKIYRRQRGDKSPQKI